MYEPLGAPGNARTADAAHKCEPSRVQRGVRGGQPGPGEPPNGYRRRDWDTRAGTIELAIPKLRSGSYFPGFLEHRRRAERALALVVATSYLLGVSTGRVEKLAASLGVTGLSRSQISAMAAELDELVEGFRSRPPGVHRLPREVWRQIRSNNPQERLTRRT
jgi:transposase-like protein